MSAWRQSEKLMMVYIQQFSSSIRQQLCNSRCQIDKFVWTLLHVWHPWSWPWFIPHPTGHIGPHSDAIRVCRELPPLLPPRWTPSFVGLGWLRILQFTLGRPGPLLYPGTCQYSACCCMRWWSIRKTCPSQRSHLSLSMLSMVCCPVLALTSTLVILSFHEMPSILLCHLSCAASRLFVSVAVNGHTSAPYRRVDRMIASYSKEGMKFIFVCTCVIFTQMDWIY